MSKNKNFVKAETYIADFKVLISGFYRNSLVHY